MKLIKSALLVSALAALGGCIAVPVGGPGYYSGGPEYYAPAPAYYGYGPSIGIGVYGGGRGGRHHGRHWRR